jgi:hypothetical protein
MLPPSRRRGGGLGPEPEFFCTNQDPVVICAKAGRMAAGSWHRQSTHLLRLEALQAMRPGAAFPRAALFDHLRLLVIELGEFTPRPTFRSQ